MYINPKILFKENKKIAVYGDLKSSDTQWLRNIINKVCGPDPLFLKKNVKKVGKAKNKF